MRDWYKNSTLKNRIAALCDSYKNSYWFSGHSHWIWEMQCFDVDKVWPDQNTNSSGSFTTVLKRENKNADANIWPANNSPERPGGWCIHIPSCGDTRSAEILTNDFVTSTLTLVVDGDTYNPEVGSKSQFAILLMNWLNY